MTSRLPPEVPEDSADLEFWRSESWVLLWSGRPLQLPALGSAAHLVRQALLPGSKVDFPQITEICELIAAKPQEGPEAIRLLVAAMRDKDGPFRKKLKALTIANEMLYDESSIVCFREVPNLQLALQGLRTLKDSGLSEYVDENIRMLATEVDKVCFSETGGGARGHASRLRSLGSALKTNLEAAAKNLRRGEESGKPMPQNTFYFDEHHQRWRQRGVADGLSDRPEKPGGFSDATNAAAAAAPANPFGASGELATNAGAACDAPLPDFMAQSSKQGEGVAALFD
ncbi:unnamed protein product [Effrenium voratum]|nr:unnamed protein product [Effrenium voratum]